MRVLELSCASQNYEWGKIGKSSAVFDLLSSSGRGQKLDQDKPYAELWMGTHVSGPSKILNHPDFDNVPLQTYLEKSFTDLGSTIINQFGIQLPFLFKVLSVRTALSIQAHPNKEHAALLHKSRPDLYKDANHKPEMAIAITPFEALCGFRTAKSIVSICTSFPELVDVIGFGAMDQLRKVHNNEEQTRDAICAAFSALMKTSDANMKLCIGKLLLRFQEDKNHASTTDVHGPLMLLFRRLHEQYGDDVGCLSMFFLNYVKLNPGEAIFLEANLPHAYISGDCVECMACSDNVVRAGLTPKFKDVDTLLAMLNYSGLESDKVLFSRVSHSYGASTIHSYHPNVTDFAVDLLEVSPGAPVPLPQSATSASVLLFMHGAGQLADSSSKPQESSKAFTRGQVLFVSAAETAYLHCVGSAQLIVYRAFCAV